MLRFGRMQYFWTSVALTVMLYRVMISIVLVVFNLLTYQMLTVSL